MIVPLDTIDPQAVSFIAAAIVAMVLATGLWLRRRGIRRFASLNENFQQSEEQLRSSQRTLSALMGSLPGMVYRCRNDRGWIVDFISEGYMELTGLSAAKICGDCRTSFAKIIHPEDRETVWTKIEAALENHSPFTLEYRIVTADGAQKWVRECGQGTFSDDGEPLTIESFVTDITIWKQAEEEIRLNESRLETLLQLNQMTDTSLKNICNFALEGGVTITKSRIGYLAFVNEDETAMEMYSWSKRAMAECAMADKPSVYNIRDTGLWGEGVRQRKPVITNDYLAPHPAKKGCPNGHVEISRHMNVPIFDRGKIVAVAGVANKTEGYTTSDVRQLTLLMQGMWRIIQRQRADKDLRRSEERFRELGQMLPEIVYETDQNGLITFVNEQASALTGFTREDFVKNFRAVDLFVPEDRERAKWNFCAATKRGTPDSCECLARRKDGSTFPVIVQGTPIMLDGKPVGVRGIMFDISRQKETEALLLKNSEQLEEIIRERTAELAQANFELQLEVAERTRAETEADQANYTKSEFLANMSHELRTPLHGILSFASFGINESGDLDEEKTRKYFQRIDKSGNTLLAIVNDLLDLAKLESGKVEVRLSHQNIYAILVGMLDEFASLTDRRKLRLVCRKPEFDPMAHVDYEKLSQVFRNLISNAVKFSPDGELIEIEIKQNDGCLTVSVSDNGVGIPQDELEAVFDKFIQSSKTRTGAGGTGLGLAICREIIDAHKGRIWAENRQEGGAKLSFEIPTQIEPDSTDSAEESLLGCHANTP